MASFCLVDFETSSACDLKKSGAWVYGEHDTTEILCLGYTFGAGEVVISGNSLFYDKLRYIDRRAGSLEVAVHDPECMFIAHNVAFEKSIWRNIMVKQFGWPDIPNERWHDSQASCAMKTLPLKLERAAMALRLPMQKDTEGTAVTLTFSKEKCGKKLPKNTPSAAERLQRVYSYNVQDLRAELSLHRRVRGLGKMERAVWLLDQTINERGVRLDMEFVSAAQAICDHASKPLAARFTELTGLEKVGSPKFHNWLARHGVMLPNLRKETLDKLGLNDDDEETEDTLSDTEEDYQPKEEFTLPVVCKEPLRLRRILGSASIKKLRAMPFCCASDGRAHGLLQYHGAGPGRWSGRLLQPHNFPRPSLKISKGFDASGQEVFEGHDPEQLVRAVLTRDHEYVEALFGNPIEAIASGLRHTLIAGKGKVFEVGDFSKIECVIVLALAGARATAEKVIASGSAVYTDMATRVFGYPVTKHMLKEYTIGKNIVLGCLAADTLVLTQRGAIPILEVCTEDQLWDGIEWVDHDGLVSQGVQKTLRWDGLCLTPDHQVFDGVRWLRADTVACNGVLNCRAVETASESLRSWPMSMENGVEYGRLWSDVHAGPTRIRSKNTTSVTESLLAVIGALKSNQGGGRKSFMDTLISFRKTAIEFVSSIASRLSYKDVRTHVPDPIEITALEAFAYGLGGRPLGAISWPTYLLWKAGINQNWSWIEKITNKGIDRATLDLYREKSTRETREPWPPCRPDLLRWKNVYDIANAGPRNRFTVLTDAGPIIVHNCGFQMGDKKFQARYAEDRPLSFATEGVRIYREDFAPEVPKLWE